MSQDDMVFEDVKHREPVRLRRPDRDRRWACAAYEVPAADDMPIFLERGTADAIERHALRDTSVELGGILLGKECVDDVTGEPFVWVLNSLEAKHFENTQASFTYTHDSWEEITRERDRLHPDLDIVGWYHTHPDFGIFLSSHDLFIQHHFFSQPLQVAYVVDPIRQTRGFFRWRNGQMEQVSGFHIMADRRDRVALVRLVNDLENLSNPSDSGGGGFSPRLEAELIAMLTRPASHHQVSSPAERAQFAAVFGMIGALLGVLGFAAILWLNHLHGTVKEQSETMERLVKAVKESSDQERLVLDTVLDGAGGKTAQDLLDQYAKASRARAVVEKQLAEKDAAVDVLSTRTKEQGDELAKLRKERDRYKQEAKDVEEAQHLRERVAELADENKKQAMKILDLGGALDTVEGRKVEDLVHKYNATWYAAAIGWTASAILLLVLAAGYIFLIRPPVEEEPASPPIIREDQPPPHRIE